MTLALFVANIVLYSAFPFYFVGLYKRFGTLPFYVYLGIVLSFGGFLGAIYSFPLAVGGNVSGGNIAYAAFMMTAIVLVIVDNRVVNIRYVVRLVITVNVFVFFLFSLLVGVLGNDAIINPFGVSGEVFSVSLGLMLLGELLIIVELLAVLYLFDLLKARIQNLTVLALCFIAIYVVLICFDGVAFPLIAFGFRREIVETVFGGLPGKVVLAASFSIPLFAFLMVFRARFRRYAAEAFVFIDLFVLPHRQLIREVDRHKETARRSDERYRHLAESIQDIFFSIDDRFDITYWNAASEGNGVSAASAVTRPLFDVLPEDRGSPFDLFLQETIRLAAPRHHLLRRVEGDATRFYDVFAYPFEGGLSIIQRDVTERIEADNSLKQSLSEKEVLIRELYHRTNNILQMIRAMLVLQAGAAPDSDAVRDIVRRTEQRIMGMAAVQELLYSAKDLSRIPCRGYVESCLDRIRDFHPEVARRVRIVTEIDDGRFLIDTAVPFGLLLNELVTNAFLHAFPSRTGTIRVVLTYSEDAHFQFTCSDDGVGLEEPFDINTRRTLGFQLIRALAEQQLQGELSIVSRPGFTFSLRFPDRLYEPRV